MVSQVNQCLCIGWVNSDIEAKLHRRFKRHREYGEWFRPHSRILRFIYANAEKTPW